MAGLSGRVRRSARRCGPSCQACLGSKDRKDRKDKNDGETGENCGFSWDFVGFMGIYGILMGLYWISRFGLRDSEYPPVAPS